MLTQDTHAVAVDPGDAAPVLTYLAQEHKQLGGILVTHRHDDHIGGIPELLAHSNVPVYAPYLGNPGFSYQQVGEGYLVDLPELETAFTVLDVPGHTARHVAYYGGKSLFCGDTLFGCGCGRVFDGSCEQLYASLQKLAALPDETAMYCAHEYTLANIRFARTVDPGNPALIAREAADGQRVAQGYPTLPSTLALEKATNPFLRCDSAAIREAALHFRPNSGDNAASVFCVIRELKNLY